MDNSCDHAPLRRKLKQIAENNLNFLHPYSLVQLYITHHEKRLVYQNQRHVWIDKQAFILLGHHKLRSHANVTGLHTIFKREDSGRVKASIVPRRHRDLAK